MSRIQGKTISDGAPVYAGVDVSKATLDLHVLGAGGSGGAGGGLRRRFSNDAAGIAALLDALAGCGADRPCRVVFEPTGRFHLGLWRELHGAGHAAVPFNPYRARHFAKADGEPAKTDAIDARVLARAAASMDLAAALPPIEESLRIKELHGLRLGTVGMLRAAKNRLGAACDTLAERLLADQIALFEAQIAELGAELARRIAARPELARRRDILASIPGIGPVSAAALIAEMPELGSLGDKQPAKLLGVAPFDRQSGNWTGRSRIKGGRRRLRAALHMAALAAARANPDLRAFRDRLRAAGKPARLILTAVLRKLVTLANILIRENRIWTSSRP